MIKINKKTIILIHIILYISNAFGSEKTTLYKINKNLIIEHYIINIYYGQETGLFKLLLKNDEIGELYYYIKKINISPFGHNKMCCHIQRLQINKNFQKNGYGNILIAFVCKKFIKEGATEITLFATPLQSDNYKHDLHRLFKFYKKYGFNHIDGESNEMILKIKSKL